MEGLSLLLQSRGDNILHEEVVETEGIKIDFSKVFRQAEEIA